MSNSAMPNVRRYSWIVYGLYAIGALVIALFWWQGSHTESHTIYGIYTILGRITALWAAYAILWEFLLISRAPLFEKHMSLEGGLKFHKWNGYASIILLLLHVVFTTLGYAIPIHAGFVAEFLHFNTAFDDVFQATIGTILFLVAVVISIGIARQYFKYETWYLVHLTTYLAVLLGFGHQLKTGVDFIKQPGFVIFWWILNVGIAFVVLFYRFVLPVWRSWYYRLQVEKVVTEAPNIYSIYIAGKNLEKFPLDAGQFGVWRFLAGQHAWQGHPFSFSSQPGESTLRLSFKTSGDFTAELPKVKTGTPVLMDGPYGKFTVGALQRNKVLMIAGGIGITPIVSILKVLPRYTTDIIIFYAAQTEKDLALRSEIETIAELYGLKLNFVIEKDPGYQGLTGYVDEEKLAKLVPDLAEREVLLCGPPPMMRAVRATLAKLGLAKRYVHYENFSF